MERQSERFGVGDGEKGSEAGAVLIGTARGRIYLSRLRSGSGFLFIRELYVLRDESSITGSCLCIR